MFEAFGGDPEHADITVEEIAPGRYLLFGDRMQLHFNGEHIDLIHTGPAHTTGDAAVIFRGRSIVHMGDVFVSAGWAFIDHDNGGDLDGLIAFVLAILDEIENETFVVPGHGPVTDRAVMVSYVEDLEWPRNRIARLIAQGADFEAIVATAPTSDLDERRGDSGMSLDRAYHSLKAAMQP